MSTTHERLERIRAVLLRVESGAGEGECDLCESSGGPGPRGHRVECPLPTALADVDALLAGRTAEDERADAVAWLQMLHLRGAAYSIAASEHVGAAAKEGA